MGTVVQERGICRKKFIGKRIWSAALGFALISICLTGCGGGEDGNGLPGSGIDGEDGQQYAEGTAMGRYVEEAVDLSDEVRLSGMSNGLYQLNNGQIVISEGQYPFLISKDHGANWYEDHRNWHDGLLESGAYIMGAAVGGDNTAAVIYQAAEGEAGAGDGAENEAADTGPEDGAESEAADTGTADEAASDVSDTDTSRTAENDILTDLDLRLLIIKPDKTQISAAVELTEEDGFLKAVWLTEESRIFVTTQSANIYEVMEDGSSELFLTAEYGRPELIQFHGNLMLMDGWDYAAPLIYDIEQKTYIEDDVIEDFVRENYADRSSFGGNWYDMFCFWDKEGALYIAGDKGVYRHVPGGGTMEQIIDGNLSIFGNPSYSIVGMIALEENEFLALFTGGKLVRFVYHADIPTVPVGKLRVYSLKDNETIRQAINQYQARNLEMYVEYEVGIGGDNAVTREDALKSLNTRIMAGDGPDVLVLDDMPVDSYIEKGILQDMSPIFNNLSGEEELFGNIVDAFRTEESIYQMPCEIRLPALLGRKAEVNGAKDMESIADLLERLRADRPGEDLLGLCTERGVLRLFSTVSVPEWMTEDGAVDRDAIARFLTQSKRIYDAQMDGISDDALDEYDYLNRHSEEEFGVPWDETDIMRVAMNGVKLVGGMTNVLFGSITDPYGYAQLVSIPKTPGYEDCEWMPVSGQSERVFGARTLLGICAASRQAEAAENFVKELFGKENQMSLYQGLAVNKAAFLEGFAPDTESGAEELWGSVVAPDKDGIYTALNAYCPNQEQLAVLQTYMESVKIPYMEDSVLEEAVYAEGVEFIQGRKSLDEAVEAVEKKMAIYLAE